MAWTAYVTIDKDKKDVGYARAVWNEGEADQFTYGRRAKISAESAVEFIAEAEAALAAHTAKVASEASLSATLTSLFNE